MRGGKTYQQICWFLVLYLDLWVQHHWQVTLDSFRCFHWLSCNKLLQHHLVHLVLFQSTWSTLQSAANCNEHPEAAGQSQRIANPHRVSISLKESQTKLCEYQISKSYVRWSYGLCFKIKLLIFSEVLSSQHWLKRLSLHKYHYSLKVFYCLLLCGKTQPFFRKAQLDSQVLDIFSKTGFLPLGSKPKWSLQKA